MTDLSLGPLRIANPDDASPDTPLQPYDSSHSVAAVSPLREDERGNGYIGEETPQLEHLSPHDNQTSEPSIHAYQTPSRTNADREQRQSMGSHQDSLQAQPSQFSATSPQGSVDPRLANTRSNSSYYSQLPVGAGRNGVSRQGSYRMRTESAESTTPQRTSSRRDVPPQGGFSSRDEVYSDRYGPAQYPPTQGSVPSRRTSHGVGSVRSPGGAAMSTTPGSGQTPISSSNYNPENGPPPSSEEWKDRGAAVSVKHYYDNNGRPVAKPIKKGVKDFEFTKTLGEGSYSTVLAATDRTSHKEYAIKVLDKRHIIREDKVKYVNIEKDTLNRLTDHPGVVRLYLTFQDERSLYFVLDLCNEGELLSTLKRIGSFDEECTRFYGAQILDTIEYMHSRGVIHRDLKPENVLLDDKKHIKITDFGTAKMLEAHKDANGRTTFDADTSRLENKRASSFVGTAEYVSPELLRDNNACKASDLWAFGCILYQLLAGRPPFKAATEFLIFQKIVALEYEFPVGFPEVAKDLIERLLVLDPQQRISLEHIKNHAFFKGIRWGKGLWQQKAPRLSAYVPPPNPPIRLNGTTSQAGISEVSPAHSTQPTMMPPVSASRPKPRVITELPPPSQLDIEWSPVLTRNNERILKLGNLNVLSSPSPHSPGHEGGKLARLFGGSTTKKRQRLVMVTSSARIVLAAAGGDEKKSKLEISLLTPGTETSSATDAKGVTHWVVHTRDKHFVFEDIKPSLDEPHLTQTSTQEWLDVIEQAKEFASTQLSNNNNSYAADESLNMSTSALSSHASSSSQLGDPGPMSSSYGSGRTLQKAQSEDRESLRGRKRFSKRQSKSGLTAVF